MMCIIMPLFLNLESLNVLNVNIYGINDDKQHYNIASKHAEIDILSKIRHKKNLPKKNEFIGNKTIKNGNFR